MDGVESRHLVEGEDAGGETQNEESSVRIVVASGDGRKGLVDEIAILDLPSAMCIDANREIRLSDFRFLINVSVFVIV